MAEIPAPVAGGLRARFEVGDARVRDVKTFGC
jgi:hypothetical protein